MDSLLTAHGQSKEMFVWFDSSSEGGHRCARVLAKRQKDGPIVRRSKIFCFVVLRILMVGERFLFIPHGRSEVAPGCAYAFAALEVRTREETSNGA